MVAEELRRASATAGDALIEARLTLLGLVSSPLDLDEIDGLLDAQAQIAIRTFRAA